MDATPQAGGTKRMQITRDLARVGLTYDDGGSASAAGDLGPGHGWQQIGPGLAIAVTAARPSLAEYCATYIRAVENAGKAKKTVALYQGVLRHLTGWVTRKCADQSCDVLTHETLDGFVAWLKNDFVSLRGNHLGDYSLHQYVNIVKIAASWGARGKRYWPVSPLAEYRAPAYIEKEPEYFEEDEVRKLFAACGTPITWTGRRLRAMFLVSLDTGMRRGELVKLTLPMVDLESGRIRLSAAITKTKKPRTVYLRPTSIEAVKLWLEARDASPGGDPNEGPLFCQLSGRSIGENALDELAKRLRARSGIERFRWHLMRHTAGTMAFLNGADSKDVRDQFGHTTSRMTDKYLHLTDDQRRSRHAGYSPVERLFGSQQRREDRFKGRR